MLIFKYWLPHTWWFVVW